MSVPPFALPLQNVAVDELMDDNEDSDESDMPAEPLGALHHMIPPANASNEDLVSQLRFQGVSDKVGAPFALCFLIYPRAVLSLSRD